jgi:hypothetical protein
VENLGFFTLDTGLLDFGHLTGLPVASHRYRFQAVVLYPPLVVRSISDGSRRREPAEPFDSTR